MFDLVSAYYHINVHTDYHKYLGFRWTFKDGSNRYFTYTVLIFGLCMAEYVFIKVICCLVTHWRQKGLRALFHLDDGFNNPNFFTNCQHSTNIIREDLDSVSWSIPKSANSNPGNPGNDWECIWIPPK